MLDLLLFFAEYTRQVHDQKKFGYIGTLKGKIDDRYREPAVCFVKIGS